MFISMTPICLNGIEPEKEQSENKANTTHYPCSFDGKKHMGAALFRATRKGDMQKMAILLLFLPPFPYPFLES